MDLPEDVSDANLYHRFCCIVRNFLLVSARDAGLYDKFNDLIALPCLHVNFNDTIANKVVLLCPDKLLDLNDLNDLQLRREVRDSFKK